MSQWRQTTALAARLLVFRSLWAEVVAKVAAEENKVSFHGLPPT
jgi:hypothetical protein